MICRYINTILRESPVILSLTNNYADVLKTLHKNAGRETMDVMELWIQTMDVMEFLYNTVFIEYRASDF